MRILIELPTWLGDAVMASAAVEAIAKYASAAFGEENQAGRFEGSAGEFLDEAKFDKQNFTNNDVGGALASESGFDSAVGDETAREFDAQNLKNRDDARAVEGETVVFAGDGKSNFSFLTQTFGAVTQERQIFAGDPQAKGASNSCGEFDDKFGANGDANLTAKTEENEPNLKDDFSADETQIFMPNGQNLNLKNTTQTAIMFGKTATNSVQNLKQKFENSSRGFKTQGLENQAQIFKNSAQKSEHVAQVHENLTAQKLELNLNLTRESQSPQNSQIQAGEPLKIVFFGSFAACELFKAHPNCERVIVDDGKKAKFRLWRLFRLAKSLGEFDAAFSFRSSFASKILLLGACAKRKFGFKKSKDGAHQVQKYLNFAKSALNLTRADDRLRLYFEPHKFDAPVLGLNPGASYGSAKRWYPHYFAQVALRFKDRFRIVIFGGAGERDMCGQIEQILRENGATCENLAGKTSIRELCENIGGIARSGGIFVTNDSGPMHVAAAYGTPTIALFGPTRFTQTCPWRNENARILHLNLACMPCMKRVCPLKTHACMKELSPQAVTDAIEREFLKK